MISPPTIRHTSALNVLLYSGLTLSVAAACGMLRGLDHPIFLALWIAHLGLLGFCTVLFAREIVASFRSLNDSRLALLLLIACIVSWVFSGVLGFLPITARDALIHHLAVPKWWLHQGFIAPISWHSWSFYPMLLQTSFAGLLSIGGLSLTPLYHLLYAIILAGLSLQLARLLGVSRFSPYAAFFCALLPVVIKLSSVPLVDLGLAVYCCASVVLIVQWLEKPHALSALGIGVAIGLALSTKPNALLFVGSLAPWVLFASLSKRLSVRTIVGGGVTAALAALLVFAPWTAQNILRTGNPVYPIAQGVFGGTSGPSKVLSEDLAEEGEGPRALSPLETRRLLHGESWLQITLIPLRIFIEGQDDNPKLFDGRLSPLLLLAFVPLFLGSKNAGLMLSLGSSLSYILFALLLTDTRVRYLAPAYGTLCALASLGLMQVIQHRRHASLLLYLVSAGQIAWSIVYAVGLTSHVRAIEYFSGRLTHEEYLARAVPEYVLARRMLEILPNNSKTYLVLTGNRFFYFDTPIESAGHTSAIDLLKWIRSSDTPEDLSHALAARGFTHLLVHLPRLTELVTASLSPSQRELLQRFFETQLAQLTQQRGVGLYELLPPRADTSGTLVLPHIER